MARRKRLFKIPFIKFKINKRTLSNSIGFILIGAGLILFLSYIQKGEILTLINNTLTGKFGFLSILFPVIIVLFGSHFFRTKKLKLIKPNITLGLVLVFIALIGTSQSGVFGKLVFDNLYLDFSLSGALVILLITFIIGLILFLNTSVDSFLLMIVTLFKMLFSVSKKILDGRVKGGHEEEFIQDRKVSAEKQPVVAASTAKNTPSAMPPMQPHLATAGQSALHIRTLSKESQSSWVYPPSSLLTDISQKEADRGDVNRNSDIIEKTLDSFGIRARVAEVNRGPTVTQYALEIVMGTKLSKITALSNDLALALAATTGQVRIEAPIPGRSLVGIEIPNKKPEIVTLKRLFTSDVFTKNQSPLLVPMGLDVSGTPIASEISKMPHVLIAGTTGSGKSVLLNAWLCSFLFRTKPEDLRLILVDPKRVEFTLYNGIPHLLTEVIVEPEKIISSLKWTIAEMEVRYKAFAQAGVRNLEGYNALPDVEKKPYIIFIIDELADLMIFAGREAEDLITRIAQMARATGIHLILATQRPSVDVITGLMKANIPARIAFNVSSMIDSRVVLDMPGAEKLLGKGDMLFLPPDQAKPRRIQGPFISEKDVQNIVKFLKDRTPVVHYTDEVVEQDVSFKMGRGGTMVMTGEDKDPLFDKVLEIIMQHDKASASLLQRRFAIGYNRAARILDQLEAAGFVGPGQGSKPREVLRRQSSDTDGNK